MGRSGCLRELKLQKSQQTPITWNTPAQAVMTMVQCNCGRYLNGTPQTHSAAAAAPTTVTLNSTHRLDSIVSVPSSVICVQASGEPVEPYPACSAAPDCYCMVLAARHARQTGSGSLAAQRGWLDAAHIVVYHVEGALEASTCRLPTLSSSAMLPDWRARLMNCADAWQVLLPSEPHMAECGQSAERVCLKLQTALGPAGAASERRIETGT
jgi:hypothetical protein